MKFTRIISLSICLIVSLLSLLPAVSMQQQQKQDNSTEIFREPLLNWSCNFELDFDQLPNCNMKFLGDYRWFVTMKLNDFTDTFHVETRPEIEIAKSPSDKAVLMAPEMRVTGDVCVEFDYAFHGANQTGMLQVGVARYPEDWNYENVMTLTGDESNGHRNPQVTMRLNHKLDEITFIAPATDDDGVTLAQVQLDDISIRKGAC